MQQNKLEITQGEQKATWRENHLCLRCGHFHVCKIATSIEPDLLVTIKQCLAFYSQPICDEELQ